MPLICSSLIRLQLFSCTLMHPKHYIDVEYREAIQLTKVPTTLHVRRNEYVSSECLSTSWPGVSQTACDHANTSHTRRPHLVSILESTITIQPMKLSKALKARLEAVQANMTTLNPMQINPPPLMNITHIHTFESKSTTLSLKSHLHKQ